MQLTVMVAGISFGSILKRLLDLKILLLNAVGPFGETISVQGILSDNLSFGVKSIYFTNIGCLFL